MLPVVHERCRLDQRDAIVAAVGAGHRPRRVGVIVGLLLLCSPTSCASASSPAWRVAVVLFAVGAVAHIVKGPHPVALAIGVGLLVAAGRRTGTDFRAPADPPSLLRLVRASSRSTWRRARRSASSRCGPSGPDRARPHPRGRARDDLSVGLVGLDGPVHLSSAVLRRLLPGRAARARRRRAHRSAVVLLFRPSDGRAPAHTSDDWEHASAAGAHLRVGHARRTSRCATTRASSSRSDGEAMIAYTYMGGYALVAGDPIGDAESVVAVVDEFLAMCDERAWTPAFLAAREADMPRLLLARASRRSTWATRRSSTATGSPSTGPRRKSVRAAVRRVGRDVPRSSSSPSRPRRRSSSQQLNAISARWRGKNPERGFTMSLSQDVDRATNPEFLLCVALDEDGMPGASCGSCPPTGTTSATRSTSCATTPTRRTG